MCYGDPFYGRDGYALRELERQQHEENQRQLEEEEYARLQQEQILEERS